jgi:ubiquinone/menaquinone biosynthesis C-methylase UbiE
MVTRVVRLARLAGVTNLDALVADAHNLPFRSGAFNLVYMITVIGEIPSPEKAFREFHRVLSPGGILAFSELALDPDFPWAKTLIRQGTAAGFMLQSRYGSQLNYSLCFSKVDARQELI